MTIKGKNCTTMKNNENVKKPFEAGVLTKRHSEGIRPKNPLHILKRFFAKYNFPFAGNSVRPAQNDGKNLADFGKSGAESGTRPSEQACKERQNLVKDLKRMQGCEPPTSQDGDFGKSEELTKNFCHSESLEKYYEFTNSYFSCYSESVNADGKPIEMDRFRISGARIKRISASPYILCSCLSGMTKNTGLLRFARNDGKFLVPQCLRNLVPFRPLSLPSPSVLRRSHKTGTAIAFHPLLACAWGEGSKNVMDLSSYRLNDLTTNKRKDCTTMKNNNNVKNFSSYRLIDFPTLKKKAAFTLAEALITLGIIGVVAAMTIPNLIAEHQKRATVTKLQRAISVINQAYKLSFDEVGDLNAREANALGTDEYFKTYWQPYIKVLTYCTDYSICGYNSNYPFTNLAGKDSGLHLTETNMRISFYTFDGFLYIIPLSHYMGEKIEVIGDLDVDINGAKGPNRYGKDVFVLLRVSDGVGVQPAGYTLSDSEINNDCKKNGVGYYCAEKIRRAGWKIEKDYPW